MEILGQGSGDDQLAAWVLGYEELPIVVRDAPGHEGESLSAMTIRETVVVLELPSMQVVYLDRGDTTGTADSSAIAALIELEQRLGL